MVYSHVRLREAHALQGPTCWSLHPQTREPPTFKPGNIWLLNRGTRCKQQLKRPCQRLPAASASDLLWTAGRERKTGRPGLEDWAKSEGMRSGRGSPNAHIYERISLLWLVGSLAQRVVGLQSAAWLLTVHMSTHQSLWFQQHRLASFCLHNNGTCHICIHCSHMSTSWNIFPLPRHVSIKLVVFQLSVLATLS